MTGQGERGESKDWIFGVTLSMEDPFCNLSFNFIFKLEIPASRVFLGADAQLLGTSLAGAKMPLCMS